MSNIHDDCIHLLVNHEGRLSLWDTQRKAILGKEGGEVQLELRLTPTQLGILQLAAATARDIR